MDLTFVAALLTSASTPLLAFGNKAGFYPLALGSACWFVVALRARYRGRPIYWQAIMSAWTFTWSVYGLLW